MDRKLSPDSDRKLSPITTQPRGVPTCLYPEEPPKVLPYAYLDHTEGVSMTVLRVDVHYPYRYQHFPNQTQLDDESEDTGSHPSPVVRPSPVTAPLVLKPSPVASTKKQRNKKSPKKTPPKKKAQRTKRKIDNTPTLAGEGTKERKEPTKEELDAEKNDRSQGALVNWYNRLNDLYGYKKIHGDSK